MYFKSIYKEIFSTHSYYVSNFTNGTFNPQGDRLVNEKITTKFPPYFVLPIHLNAAAKITAWFGTNLNPSIISVFVM